MLTPNEIAIAVTKALDEKKGMDIKLLKIDKVSSLADYFLICTGTSNTHVRTLCDYAEYTLEQLGEPMLGREGHRGNSWELLDTKYRGVEQLVARRAHNPEVVGSSPASATIKSTENKSFSVLFLCF